MQLQALGSGWLPLLRRTLSEAPAAASVSLQLDEAKLGTLVTWLDLVVRWGARIDLTAARSESELVDLLLADASILAAASEHERRVIDVGSGVGAPGLALALLRPELKLTLLEPREKRAAFLRTALGALERSDVELLRCRSTQVQTASFEVAVSRATLPPPLWLREGARLATGAVWVLLAKEEPPSVDGWRIDRDVHYVWPLVGSARHAVRYKPGR
jgi:16S rRNA (guanine527-N7)-methyltransferase